MNLIPFTDLERPLSFNEESGVLSNEIGLSPNRHHAMGQRKLPRWHVAYAHPSIHHPRR